VSFSHDARTVLRDVLNEMRSEQSYDTAMRFKKADQAREACAHYLGPEGVLIDQVLLGEQRHPRARTASWPAQGRRKNELHPSRRMRRRTARSLSPLRRCSATATSSAPSWCSNGSTLPHPPPLMAAKA
jgi:hypothetical protein